MVTRYSWFTDGVKPTYSGRYVLHEDYVALQRKLEEVKALLAQRESELSSAYCAYGVVPIND